MWAVHLLLLILLNRLTEKEDGAISTIVLRGSTDNLMDDIERAVDDGVNTFKVLTRVSTSSDLNLNGYKEIMVVLDLNTLSVA